MRMLGILKLYTPMPVSASAQSFRGGHNHKLHCGHDETTEMPLRRL